MTELEHHLPAWLRMAKRAPFPTRVEFGDSEFVVTVFPQQQCYLGNAPRTAGAVLATAEARVTALRSGCQAGGRPLDQLEWTMAVARLQASPLAVGDRLRRFRLAAWPSLPRLPDDLVADVARICALLDRKPTRAELVPLTLGIPEARAFALLAVLNLRGHLRIHDTAESEEVASGVTARADPQGPAPASRERWLLVRLWKRLMEVR